MQAAHIRAARPVGFQPCGASRAPAGCGRLAAAACPARRHRQLRLQPAAASAEPPADPTDSASASSSMDGPPRAVSLPVGLPTAGAVFVMAGALKLAIMCFPWSEASILAFVYGRSDLGVQAALKSIPIALALAAAAKAIVDRGLQKKRWMQWAIVAVGVVMLWISRLVFARPKASPLDPMFRRMQQERVAAISEQRQAERQQQQQRRTNLLQQPDAERGRQLQQAAAKGRQ